jgi:hypothetical protein
MRVGRVHPWGSWDRRLAGLSLLAMSIIRTTTTSLGARRHPADAEVWIPLAVSAGVGVEHSWTGSHAVLEFDGVRMDAPLREARRTLRRMLSATAVVIAIAVALVWVALGVAAYASLAHLGY